MHKDVFLTHNFFFGIFFLIVYLEEEKVRQPMVYYTC